MIESQICRIKIIFVRNLFSWMELNMIYIGTEFIWRPENCSYLLNICFKIKFKIEFFELFQRIVWIDKKRVKLLIFNQTKKCWIWAHVLKTQTQKTWRLWEAMVMVYAYKILKLRSIIMRWHFKIFPWNKSWNKSDPIIAF